MQISYYTSVKYEDVGMATAPKTFETRCWYIYMQTMQGLLQEIPCLKDIGQARSQRGFLEARKPPSPRPAISQVIGHVHPFARACRSRCSQRSVCMCRQIAGWLLCVLHVRACHQLVVQVVVVVCQSINTNMKRLKYHFTQVTFKFQCTQWRCQVRKPPNVHFQLRHC